MTPQDFIAKWKNGGDERRDAQPFFEDLCRLVGHGTPRELDPEHEWFTYEYGAAKTSGGEGWADVWKKGFFGWEAKGTHKSLDRAYEQLKMYADALQNPPLLVVSDLQTIIVHTNFTNTVKGVHRFTVAELGDFDTRQKLEAVFKNPDRLRPGVTRAAVTQEAADKFTRLATALRDRGHEAQAVAHFLNRLLFCMFAEDIGLLSGHLFTKLVERSQNNAELFEKRSRELFGAMHTGGDVAFENIEWFNGGLFENDSTLRLEAADLKLLLEACKLDWSEIEPSVFGTLFERGLDPDKRSQLGAHYTDPETIMKIVRPVVVEPWLAQWEAEKAELAKLIGKATRTISKAAQTRFNSFLERLRAFTVLDPACGSGNFLYLALRSLKDIEKRILIEAEMLGLPRQFPDIGPKAVKGIELNGYAAELARVTIWIGEIQWMIANGYGAKKEPILQPLEQIECRDALLNADGTEAIWPTADVVVGNPPFLGAKHHHSEFGESYLSTLRTVYSERVPGLADFVCYWFAKLSAAMDAGTVRCAGLVATNSIRDGRSNAVLADLSRTQRIFSAWSDEEWINDGAAVRVSIICVSNPRERPSVGDSAVLNGKAVGLILPDLTEGQSSENSKSGSSRPHRMKQNEGRSFIGTQRNGPFDIDGSVARTWLMLPNPNGRPNSDVVRPWTNALGLVRRESDLWLVDFGASMTNEDASLYEAPFAHVLKNVKPLREKVRRQGRQKYWWRFGEAMPALRAAVSSLERILATPLTSKHRVFCWLPKVCLPENTVVVVARDDDTSFGILHSRIHESWSLKFGNNMGMGNDPRYTPTTCFETFPFPEGLTPNIAAADYAADPRAVRIADAARALVEARDRWLNPPEWTDRVPDVVPGYPDRIVAKPGHEADLKKRTLTNLYNARPT